MTNREFYNAIVKANLGEDITNHALGEIGKLDKKNAKRKAEAGQVKEENKPIAEAIVSALAVVSFQQMPYGIVAAAFAVVQCQCSVLIFVKVFSQMFIIGRPQQQHFFGFTTQRKINEVFGGTPSGNRHHAETAVRKIILAPLMFLRVGIDDQVFHYHAPFPLRIAGTVFRRMIKSFQVLRLAIYSLSNAICF